MASIVRTFDRKNKRDGKAIKIIDGVRQYAKVSEPQKHAPRSKKFKKLLKPVSLVGEK